MRLFLICMIAASILSLTPKVFADINCIDAYGGGQSCSSGSLSITKRVVNPMTGQDVHDMGVNDPSFGSGQTVTFHITVTNNASITINNATVEDDLPQFVTFASGPGVFNSNANTLTFPISNLLPGTSQTFTVSVNVMNSPLIPATDKTCVINQATVSSNNQISQDSSQFCILPTATTSVLAATSVASSTPTLVPQQMVTSPATGANGLLLGLLLPLGLGGYGLSYFAKERKYKI